MLRVLRVSFQATLVGSGLALFDIVPLDQLFAGIEGGNELIDPTGLQARADINRAAPAVIDKALTPEGAKVLKWVFFDFTAVLWASLGTYEVLSGVSG